MKCNTQTYNEIYNALERCVNGATWVNGDYDNQAYQARALFTALCVMFNIEADTSKCDEIISDLFYVVKEFGYTMEADDFYNFMIEHIV